MNRLLQKQNGSVVYVLYIILTQKCAGGQQHIDSFANVDRGRRTVRVPISPPPPPGWLVKC